MVDPQAAAAVARAWMALWQADVREAPGVLEAMAQLELVLPEMIPGWTPAAAIEEWTRPYREWCEAARKAAEIEKEPAAGPTNE